MAQSRSDKAGDSNSPARSSRTPRCSSGWVVVCLSAIFTAVFVITALLRIPIGIRRSDDPTRWEWVWNYASKPPWFNLMFAVPLFAGILIIFHFANRPGARKWVRFLLAAMFLVAVFAGHLSTTALGEYGLVEHVSSMLFPGLAGAYYLEAEKKVVSPREYLADFHHYIDRSAFEFGVLSNTRINVHPPGNTLFVWLLREAVKRSEVLREGVIRMARRASAPFNEMLRTQAEWPREGEANRVRLATLLLATWVFQGLSVLAFIPGYFLAKVVLGEDSSFLGGSLAILIPSVFLFEPGPDQSYSFILLLILLFSYLALMKKSIVSAVAAGVVLYVGLFFSLAFLLAPLIVLLSGVFFLLSGIPSNSRLSPPRLCSGPRACRGALNSRLPVCVSAVAGFVAAALAMYLVFGYRTVSTVEVCLKNHADFYRLIGADGELVFPRTYWKWLLLNPVEFFMFAGGSIAALFGLSFVRNVSCLFPPPRGRGSICLSTLDSRLSTLGYLFWGFALSFGILWISGKNSGEVARLWMFLMPVAALVGLGGFREASSLSRGPALSLPKGSFRGLSRSESRRLDTILLTLQVVQILTFRLLFDVYEAALKLRTGSWGWPV